MSLFFDKILQSSESGLLKGIGRRLLDTVTDTPKHLGAVLEHHPHLEIGHLDLGRSHQTDSDDLVKQLETSLHFGHEFGEVDLEKFVQSVNRSQELTCLIRAAETQPERYCPVYWDEVLCWPHTAPGTTAVLKCFEELEGIKYDSSQNASRYCTPAGVWDNLTDYSRCRERGELAAAGEGGTSTLLTSHLYLAGYSLSLAALLLAVGVFVYFKDLRCLRNTIHTNLMCTYILFGFIWILNLTLQMSVQRDNISCLVLVVFFHYFYLTNFFWMLVEGLYLYMLVVKTFTGENIKLRVYASIGWGAPAVFVTLWTFVRVFVPVEVGAAELKELAGMPNVCQFMQEHPCDWIYKGPAMAGLALNLLFLIRIMWVLITKLRSANTLETQQYRKATKALLVLIPLLGITYLLVLYGPSNGYSAELFDYARAILLSTQGFTVALFYCFLNTEVQNAMRHHLERWQAKRSVGGGRRYHYNYTKDWSPRSRTESIRLYSQPTNIYHKRESTASETTTTTLVGFPVGNKGQMVTRPPNSISPKLLQPYNSTTIENTLV